MSAPSFFDTNVLVYADDKARPAKQKRAVDLVAEYLRARTGVVSVQVLEEYFVTVTRKLGVDPSIARRKVELLAEFDLVAPEVRTFSPRSTSTVFTDFPSGMLWFCGQPNRLDAGFFSQKTCKQPG
jgi:predicted nucleic acid-binding protein